MKKKEKRVSVFLGFNRKQKVLLTMKLLLIFLMACFMQVSATVYSQSIKFSFDVKNKKIEDVLREIEETSNFRFFYQREQVDVGKTVNLNIDGKTVEEVLSQLFKGQDVVFDVKEDNLILIKSQNVESDITSELITSEEQQKPLTGKVTDQNGMPMPGVTVVVKGTTNGTITGGNGEYSFSNLSSEVILSFSFVGMLTKDIVVGDQTIINVTLEENMIGIEEVVVTALGIERETKTLSYSVTEINGEEVSRSNENNVMNALSGKVAGVDISTLGTGIAGSSQVLIRGNTTISEDNNPLYVVDGIPMERSSFSESGRDFGDALSTFNSNDIENISILKGAAASALYGSRAANGVILITTKKGTKRSGLGITYSGSYGVQNYVNPFRSKQTTYGLGVEGKKPDINLNGWAYNAHQEWGAKYDGSEAYYPDNTTLVPWGYSYNGDHWDEFMRTGVSINNSLAFSGGGENGTYRLSISDLRYQDPLPNSDMKRKTIAITTNTKFGKRINVDSKVSFSTMNVNNRPNTQSYIWTLGHMPTMWDVNWAKGTNSKIGANEDGNMLAWSTNEYYHNPYWAAYQNETNDARDHVSAYFSVHYDIADWLFATARIGMDVSTIKARTVEAYGATQFASGTGDVREFTNRNFEQNMDYSLVFNKNLSDFNVNAMFGGSSTRNVQNRDGVRGTKLTIPYYHVVTNATIVDASVSHSEYGINSLYGSAELSYKDFIFFNVTGRNDWFSSLSPESNSIFYPSVGLSYLFSSNFELPEWISFGKVRGSYAEVGGGARPYMTKFGYDLDAQGYNGNPLISLPTTIPKLDLMPYESREWEIGTDLRFFNNRASIDYSYYDKITSNDIVNVSIPPSTGYSQITVNLGKTSNKGHEVLVNLVPLKTKTLQWDVTLVYSHNKSEILDLGGVSELQMQYVWGVPTTIKQIVGKPASAIVGYRQAVDEASGQPIWYWNASRGIWFPQRTDKPEVLGTGINPNSGSVKTTFKIKDFILSAYIDSKWGAKVYSHSEWDMTGRGHSERTAEYRDTGIPVEGVYKNESGTYEPITTNNLIPYEGNNFENYYRYGFGNNISTYNLFDASFVKFREISLGYQIPKNVLSGLSIQKASVTLVGRNLCDIYNKLPNGDVSTSTGMGNAVGIEFYSLPSTRSFTLNLNVTF